MPPGRRSAPSGRRPSAVLTLYIESGARSGDVVRLEGRRITVGRDARADLRFDPHRDREVSTHHAVLARDDEGWFVRDLGSRNGTWVDDVRVEGDQRLEGGETLRFGPDGPRCRVELENSGDEGSPPPTHAHRHDRGEGSLTRRIRAEVSRRTRALTLVVAGLGLAFALALAVVGIRTDRRAQAWEQERRELEARLDSVLRASESTAGALDEQSERIEGLSEALTRSRERVRELRSELDRARTAGTAEARNLRGRLQAATAALERQQLAASLDFAAIRERNARAVTQIFVERDDGSVVTGTGFAVRPDGTIVTARHLIDPPDGDAEARRLAVQFSGSEQVWPAELLRLDREADLALLRVLNIEGAVPTVVGVNAQPDTLASGSPVAVLGFPLGGAGAPGDGAADGPPRPLLSAGVVDRVDRYVLEIQGYGERGASGSPVFDATGRVVGVVYGGRELEEGGRRLVGTPADAILRLLAEDPEGPTGG